MAGLSIVRRNLMTIKGYVPYCGDMHCPKMPRTSFIDGQFSCPCCGWRSQFEERFIEDYKNLIQQQEEA